MQISIFLMSRLKEKINHWNKPTQYQKQITQKSFFDVCVRFFYYCTPQLCHSECGRSRVDGTKNVFWGEHLFDGDVWGNKESLH